jgi:hypothetical protein
MACTTVRLMVSSERYQLAKLASLVRRDAVGIRVGTPSRSVAPTMPVSAPL